jgi:hypothetical protein
LLVFHLQPLLHTRLLKEIGAIQAWRPEVRILLTNVPYYRTRLCITKCLVRFKVEPNTVGYSAWTDTYLYLSGVWI